MIRSLNDVFDRPGLPSVTRSAIVKILGSPPVYGNVPREQTAPGAVLEKREALQEPAQRGLLQFMLWPSSDPNQVCFAVGDFFEDRWLLSGDPEKCSRVKKDAQENA